MKRKKGKSKILKSQWRSITSVIMGHVGYRGELQLLLNKIPCHEGFVFKKIGKYYFAENNGFVRVYEHNPGTTDGFAGREITLTLTDGNQKVFKGSLWDPTGYDDTIPEYRAVSITDDPKVMDRGHTFYGGYITKAFYKKLISAPHIVIKRVFEDL